MGEQLRWTKDIFMPLLMTRLKNLKNMQLDSSTESKTASTMLWAYARDRSWGGGDPPMVASVYAVDLKAEQSAWLVNRQVSEIIVGSMLAPS